MEGGSKLFRDEVPYSMILEGTVNGGSKFRVEGKGVGHAEKGYQKGKWVCTSGEMPIPWSVLTPTLGYGYLVFANYPNGISHFFAKSFPEGFTYDRTMTFDNDGVIKTHHDIFWQKGVVMNKVTFTAEGFKPDSPVLNFGIGVPEMSVATCTPNGDNGGRYELPQAFPLKGGNREFVHATAITHVRLLGTPRVVKWANTHFIKAHQQQFKDVDDKSEHICQHESLTAFDFYALDDFNKKIAQ